MIGKPYAGELHVRFDEGEQDFVSRRFLNGHEAGNGGYSQGPTYQAMSLFSTLPRTLEASLTLEASPDPRGLLLSCSELSVCRKNQKLTLRISLIPILISGEAGYCGRKWRWRRLWRRRAGFYVKDRISREWRRERTIAA
jgi:hypothetical protein